MFVIHGQIHGQAGTLDAIVATSDAEKAASHFRRMTRSGLHPIIKDSTGRTCSLWSILSAAPAHA